MTELIKFLPKRKRDVVAYGGQVDGTLKATGFDPKTLNLTPDDVTELGTLYTAAKGDLDALDAVKAAKTAKTKAFSGPGGSYEQLAAKLRIIASAARISNASDMAVGAIGVNRRDPQPTPKTVPMTAPEFSLEEAKPGYLRLRFREAGSARPRARAANTTGVQVAVVDASKPETDGEADTVPYLTLTRSPMNVNSAKMPAEVRLYARWIGSRGNVGAWSSPVPATVP